MFETETKGILEILVSAEIASSIATAVHSPADLKTLYRNVLSSCARAGLSPSSLRDRIKKLPPISFALAQELSEDFPYSPTEIFYGLNTEAELETAA